MDKRSLTEEDIKFQYITPAIVEKAGWKKILIRMEYYFTDGRVIFQGKIHARQKGKKADYLLFLAPNQPIAIVEAKDNNKPLGGGMQQAMEYAQISELEYASAQRVNSWAHINYLQVNNLIFVPQLEIPSDKLAIEQISSIFPDSTIIPVEVKGIVKKGGALNCVSWNYYNN